MALTVSEVPLANRRKEGYWNKSMFPLGNMPLHKVCFP